MSTDVYNQWLLKNIKPFDQQTAEQSDYLRVCFQVGNICTNDCVYCPPGCKDGTYPWPSYEQAAKIINKIDQIYKSAPYNKKKIQFELLGGEVTLWKDIERVIELIYSLGNTVCLVTNGVRTVRWWQEYGKYFEYITLSVHAEFAEKEHCTDVLNVLVENNVKSHALMLMLPSHWQKCLDTIDYMVENGKFELIRARPLTLIGEQGNHDRWPYSDLEWKWLEENPTFFPKAGKVINTPEGPNWESTLWRNSVTKEIKIQNSEEVISLKQNNWKGWNCFVGIDTLYLEQNGDIRRDAMCYVRPPIGNWKRDNLDELSWPFEPVRCPFNSCFCTHDMKARKFKI
jgi:sulfatase maturation enzyme AslB (radical SAM superfamily)